MQWLDEAILWPLSGWLLANIVRPLNAGAVQLTPRRMVYLAFFILCTAAAMEYFAADIAIMIAGDSALYFEIVTFSYVAIVRAHAHRVLAPVARTVLRMARGATRLFVRAAARTRRAAIRLPRLFAPDDSGDVPDGMPACA